MQLWRKFLYSPEFNVLLFAFLLNYPWEFLQVPFFLDIADAGHWEAILFCSRAAGGDALIALASFWAVAMYSRRRWIYRPKTWQVFVFMAIGVAITIAFEWHATEIAERWTYAEHMPTLPILGTGLLPVLQWLVLPPLVVWLVYRQAGRVNGDGN